MKTWLILIALAALGGFAALVLLGSRVEETVAGGETLEIETFEVEVERPRVARPLFGILPRQIEEKLGEHDERFDHTSPGAEIAALTDDGLQLRAEGWNLSIETDGDGNVAPGTYVEYPFAVGGRQVPVRCRPADPAVGYLRTSPGPRLDWLDGRFLVELVTCENARTGKTIDWPPSPPAGLPPWPLTVRGGFEGLSSR